MRVVKLGKSYQVSLPKRLIREMGLEVGDYFKVEREGGRLVFIPKTLVDKECSAPAAERKRSAARPR